MAPDASSTDPGGLWQQLASPSIAGCSFGVSLSTEMADDDTLGRGCAPLILGKYAVYKVCSYQLPVSSRDAARHTWS